MGETLLFSDMLKLLMTRACFLKTKYMFELDTLLGDGDREQEGEERAKASTWSDTHRSPDQRHVEVILTML